MIAMISAERMMSALMALATFRAQFELHLLLCRVRLANAIGLDFSAAAGHRYVEDAWRHVVSQNAGIRASSRPPERRPRQSLARATCLKLISDRRVLPTQRRGRLSSSLSEINFSTMGRSGGFNAFQTSLSTLVLSKSAITGTSDPIIPTCPSALQLVPSPQPSRLAREWK